MSVQALNYQPETLARELKPFYIGASEADQKAMLQAVGLKNLDDLYAHIGAEYKFKGPINLPRHMEYKELIQHMNDLANKNKRVASFISDGLPAWRPTDVVGPVCSIRGLTTAYTPYQPERSQGTLQTLWIYQSLLGQLTGFEAINASLYERSTCLYEALLCAQRIVKNSTTVIVAETLYPGDLEVLDTHAIETNLKIQRAPVSSTTGTLDLAALEKMLVPGVAAVAFPQINCLGNMEEVDALTDMCAAHGVKSIAVVDPMLLQNLKPPVSYGKHGTDMVVAEGQHLALGPNFGGPGLGIFGIRYSERDKNSIRSTAGRYIGKTVDNKGRECKALILSTREQHIRREKATSNICSNQSFVASLAGACLMARGDEGLQKAAQIAHDGIRRVVREITKSKGVTLRFAHTPSFNEVVLKLPVKTAELQAKARAHGLHIGVDVSHRFKNIQGENLLLLAVTDWQSESDITKLVQFFHKELGDTASHQEVASVPENFRRHSAPGIPKLASKDIIEYYNKLGQQNLSPDDGI